MQNATNRAYATPNNSSSSSNLSTSSNSSTSSAITNYNFNITPRLELGINGRTKAANATLKAKQDFIYSAFDAKEKKWNDMMDNSGL